MQNLFQARAGKVIAVLVLLVVMVNLTGCAQTMQALEHREMQVTVKVSNSILLDPKVLAKNRNIFIRVSNTSDMQEIDFRDLLAERLREYGMNVVSDPTQANYIIQANVLYMDYVKQGTTMDGMNVGALIGGSVGALSGGTVRDAYGLGLAGALAGSLIGGVIGSAVKVETYTGVVDVEIQEQVEGGVKGKIVADIAQGTSTKMQTEKEIQLDYQTYRTKVVAYAKQTNIDRMEAARTISARLAKQIANFFRI